MHMHNPFPNHRRLDPKRSAEAAVYDELAQAQQPGRSLYEVHVSRTAPELDFAVLLEGVAVFGIQVKGGRYVLDGNQWRLLTDDGPEDVPCPMTVTWDASMQVREAVNNALGRKVFVIPVLLFPDMSGSAAIEARAENDRVRVMFGTERLVDRLIELVADQDIFCPPTAWMVSEMAEALMPAHRDEDPDVDEPSGSPAEGPEDGAAQSSDLRPIVHHADVVNIYQAPVTIFQRIVGDDAE